MGKQYYKLVNLEGAESIEFVDFVKAFEFSAFRALDAGGNDLGYVCEFAPAKSRSKCKFHLQLVPENTG